MSTSLDGKRILITQAETSMGPALCKVFATLGATVIANNQLLDNPNLPAEIVRSASHIDVLVINLAVPAPFTRIQDVDDLEWSAAFMALVDPMPRLVSANASRSALRGSSLQVRRGLVLLSGV